MSYAIFLCPVNEYLDPIMPPFSYVDSELLQSEWGDIQISYTDESGHARGAFSIGSMFGERRYVTFDTSPETVAALEADERFERVA